jgi:hypothetical protein
MLKGLDYYDFVNRNIQAEEENRKKNKQRKKLLLRIQKSKQLKLGWR